MSGRIRSIKPETLEDELMADLSDAAWRLYVASWVMADDHGRFRAGARHLAADVWQDTRQEKRAEAALGELREKGRVRCYVVAGQRYAEIRPSSWRAHQRIDHPGKPRVPVPNETQYIDAVSRTVSENSTRLSVETTTPSESLAPRARAQDLRPPTSDLDHRPPTGSEAEPVSAESGEFVTAEPATATRRVFDHWLKVLAPLKFNRAPALTPGRRRVIDTRLREDSTESELCLAIDGVLKSDHHCGKNDAGETYIDLTTIFRNREKVEWHMARADAPPKQLILNPVDIAAKRTNQVQEELMRKAAGK